MVLNDPLYGSCPVTLMANYRKYIIYNFPELKTLDLISIHDSERKAVKVCTNLRRGLVLYCCSITELFIKPLR